MAALPGDQRLMSRSIARNGRILPFVGQHERAPRAGNRDARCKRQHIDDYGGAYLGPSAARPSSPQQKVSNASG